MKKRIIPFDIIIGVLIYVCLAFLFPESNLFYDRSIIIKALIAVPIYLAINYYTSHLTKGNRIKKQID
jgi:hypothetical protein